MKLLNVPEAAQLLRVSIPTLRLWVQSRRVPVVRLGRRVLIEETELEAIVAAGRSPAKAREEK